MIRAAPARWFAVASALCLASPAFAQSIEQFYRGKTIEIVVGYPTGASNDIYARALAQRIGGHIPGKPAVIVRNMPGAGSFVAANHMATAAPRDGTSMGLIAPTAPLDERLGTQGARFKTAAFNWIGRVNSLVNVIFMSNKSPVASINDARTREATLAGTGAGSAVSVYPTVLNNVVGTKFKLVMGYRGSAEAMLAVERGEAEGHCTGWDTLKSAHPDWVANGSARVIAQFAATRHPELPDIPTALDFATTPEQKQLLGAVVNASEIGSSFFTSPEAPADRVEALRRAFDETMNDPDFIADLKQTRVGLNPLRAEVLQSLVGDVAALTPDLADRLRPLYGGARGELTTAHLPRDRVESGNRISGPRMNFTFLHCADLHLGSPMTGLSLKDETIAERFAAASREAFTDLVTRAIEERVAFALIAGDLYDAEWKDNSVGLFFNRQASRLTRENIPIYIIKGNHDAASVVTKSIALSDKVIEFSTSRNQTIEIAERRVAIHGRGFPHRAVAENWARDYPAAKPGWFNIGLLHTSCAGNALHETYAPCSIDDMVSRGYDYWALGHVHAFEVLHRDPWIVFPGNLQGRNIRETGAKGAVFVDVVDGRVRDIRRVIVDKARWIDTIVDLSDMTTKAEALFAVEAGLAPTLKDAAGKLVAARVRLVGATMLDIELHADRQQLVSEVQAVAHHLGEDLWIEKVRVETRAPGRGRAAADLSGLDLDATLSDCAADPEFRDRVNKALAEIAHELPTASPDDPSLGEDIEALIDEARAIVLTRAGSGASQ
jgi:exonuclease SbcD